VPTVTIGHDETILKTWRGTALTRLCRPYGPTEVSSKRLTMTSAASFQIPSLDLSSALTAFGSALPPVDFMTWPTNH
jgi:hypothetical protein